MGLHIEITAPGGSKWVVTESVSYYGRPIPGSRRFWAQRVGQLPLPSHLAGLAGFYAGSLDAVAARLKGA